MNAAPVWCVVPAAGSGRRFGGEWPKQYADLGGRPMLLVTLERLAGHPAVAGLVVALAADDRYWPGIERIGDTPVLRCAGGAERADSVLAGLEALPAAVGDDDWVMVHDAARPCVAHADLDALLERGRAHAVGALLAVPLADTLKRADGFGAVVATVPRERLWRAQTPQLFRRGPLAAALRAAKAAGAIVTDEASALERLGKNPLLVESSDDNLKVTSRGDLDRAAWILRRAERG